LIKKVKIQKKRVKNYCLVKDNNYRNALRTYAASNSKLFDLMHGAKPKLYGFNDPSIDAAI
jgi:hypothetical protein